ncbi:MAG: hypothetical protein LBH24_05555 [Clostridiales bacterium]|jgi:hypothetical protein|nr:hypothetical protein [Clostridiales bacterium]
MKDLCRMTPEKLTLYATAIAMELAKDGTEEELCVLKTLIGQIHHTLCTLTAQRALLARCDRE